MESPRPVLCLADADTRAREDHRLIHGALRVFEYQTGLAEKPAVHLRVDPQGLANLSRTRAEIQRAPTTPSCLDLIDSQVRL